MPKEEQMGFYVFDSGETRQDVRRKQRSQRGAGGAASLRVSRTDIDHAASHVDVRERHTALAQLSDLM
jgi:hypothetical protein